MNPALLLELTAKAAEMEKRQPAWSAVKKKDLPAGAFAYVGESEKKGTWKFPFKWTKPGGGLEVHIGGLRAALAAAGGARQPAAGRKGPPPGVIAKLTKAAKTYGVGEKGEEALEESVAGSHEELHEMLRGALQASHNAGRPEKHYASVVHVFGTVQKGRILATCYDCREAGKRRPLWEQPFTVTEGEATLGDPQMVELTTMKATGTTQGDITDDQGAGAGEAAPAVATAEEEDKTDYYAWEQPQEDGVAVFESAEISETVLGDEITLTSGPIILEDQGDGDPRRPMKGRVPMIKIGAKTLNDRIYTEECVSDLIEQVRRIRESGGGRQLPIGTMYATHGPAKAGAGQDRMLGIAAYVTDIRRRPGTDLVDTYWESAPTMAGGDIAGLIRTSPFVKGVSLRALAFSTEVRESDGATLVNGMHIRGVDFTMDPAMQYADGDDTRIVVNEEEGEAEMDPITLEKLKAENPALYEEVVKLGATQALESDAVKVAMGTAKKLEEMVLKDAARDRKDAVAAITEGLKEKIEKEDSTKDLSETTQTAMLAALSGDVDRVVGELLEADGYEIGTQGFREKALGKLEPAFDEKAKTFGQIALEEKKKGMGDTRGGLVDPFDPTKNFQIGGLPRSVQVVGEERERNGLGRENGEMRLPAVKDMILQRAFGLQMYEDAPEGGKRRLFETVYPAQALCLNELRRAGVYKKHPFYVNEHAAAHATDALLMQSPIYGRFMGVVNKMLQKEMLEEACDAQLIQEANEVTSATALGTLIPDFREGILEAVFAQSAYLALATLVPCASDQYKIMYEDHRRLGDHVFGTFAYGGSFTADEAALTYADRGWVKVTTAVDTNTVFTITYTNQNSVSTTTTVTILTTDVAGTYKEIIPATVGDRILDVSGATASGWTSAGAVSFIAEDPTRPVAGGSETATSGKARTVLTTVTGTVVEHDLEAELTWQLLEDAQKALAATGPGRWDAAGRIVANLGKEIATDIDIAGLGRLNGSTVSTGAARTFDVSSSGIGTTYTESEWKSTLMQELIRLRAQVNDRSDEMPDTLAVNIADEEKMSWMDDFVRNPQRAGRGGDFFSALSIGTVAGMNAFVAQAQNHNRMLAVAKKYVFHAVYIPLEVRGPFPFANATKTDTYVARQRVADVAPRTATRGYLTITE